MTPHSAPSSAASHPAWWIIALSLAAIAINMSLSSKPAPPEAIAQNVRGAGARGVFAFTGQLTANTFGVFMVDVDAGTIWCYEYIMAGGQKRLRLVTARSWIYDRYLEEYNVDAPSVSDIQRMVEQQRSAPEDSP